jgi:peptidoglycan/LPS O-acetylase OafA/YrhL
LNRQGVPGPVLKELVSVQNGMSKMRVTEAKPSLVHLDLLRGLAALAVFFGHLRGFVFVPYGDLSSRGVLNTGVWLMTGFGHQAVMVFFVLSGFFITKSLIEDDAANRFSWQTYLIKRLTRLWVVLIPCLLLTLIWDICGQHFSQSSFYDGKLYHIYNSGPTPDAGGDHLDLLTLLGNIVFLQTIKAPIFGSNGPLWSLANEWWYYIIFLFLFMAIRSNLKNVTNTCALLTGMLLICVFVGKYMILDGLVWLFGSAAFVIHQQRYFHNVLRRRLAVLVAIVFLGGALAASKGNDLPELLKDYAVGAASTVLVLALAAIGKENARGLYARCAHSIAESSYTIYLAHFPFIAVVINVVFLNRKFDGGAQGYIVFVLLGALTLIYCYGVYWLFERHTGKVRRYCLNKWRARPVAVS